ncbi:MAG TPA: type 4a pilus biogenesis protein PilO [bacterium]|nr:type 4a pilus biogenesis protein PilO [bacterium]HOG38424.1 type 4a pilus biogenesis protein PilO [bacterium]HQI03315.1 type 4a pilus biogenesis protein PilO [bacterium]
MPTIKSIKEKSKEIKQQRLELNMAMDLTSDSSDSKENIGVLKKRLSPIESTFLKKGEELDFIKMLESIALKNNINQTIVPETQKENTDNSFSTMNLKLTLTGSFKNVFNYIVEIESLPNYINIKSINITKVGGKFLSDDSDSKEMSEVSCDILAETYWK